MHIHEENRNIKNLFTAIVLNIVITIAEIIGGIVSGSLALFSDAFHNFSDVFSLIISYVAINVAKKPSTNVKTYGYKRAEILTALFNILLLFFICGFVVYEAVKRLYSPQHINAPIMFAIALLGLLINGLSAMLLHGGSGKNINIKSSYLHMFGDAISSAAVLVVAFMLFFVKWYFLDSIASFFIVAYIMKESFSVFMDTVNILMQGTPKGIDVNKIIARLKKERKLCVRGVHHVHIWNISSEDVIFDAHVVVAKKCLKQTDAIINKINEILVCDFNIGHSTIQLEGPDFDHSKECKL